MARYIENRNNGVIAVIAESDIRNFSLAMDAGGDPTKVGVRVFTFCDPERFQKEPGVFTGDYAFLKFLIGRGGHVLLPRDFSDFTSKWSGFVPFSNQEHRQRPDGDWKKWVTTAQDVVEKFELLK